MTAGKCIVCFDYYFYQTIFFYTFLRGLFQAPVGRVSLAVVVISSLSRGTVADDQEVHRDTQPKRTGTVEWALIPTNARTPSKASEMDGADAVASKSGGMAGRVDGSEVAANTPAKMLREVGGVKGAMSPSPNAIIIA